MNGLDEQQLHYLIRHAEDAESLLLIKQHLEGGSFRFVHLQGKAPALIQECIDKAKELQWMEHLPEIKQAFFERLGDLL